MPILIRIIAQRLVIYLFGLLAFFGINPDVSIPTPEVVEERKEEQQTIVDEILTPTIPPISTQQETESIREIESKIVDIQKGITETLSSPIVSISETTIPENIIDTQETKTFSTRNVLVHIICLEKTKTYTRMSSGSGVLISSSGIILTNAHVTYPFLFSSQFEADIYSCSVRPESIPNFGYNAELVYFPIDWLKTNKDIIKDPAPIGTGEDDYAILRITTPLGPTPRSSTFEHALVETTVDDLKKDISATVAGYPSTNTGVFDLDIRPGLSTAITRILDYFTFSGRSYDVLQTDVNTVAKRGSSGGGVFVEPNLYGLIVTTNANSKGSYINALTIPYIKKDFEDDTGIDFDEFINSSHELLKLRFNTTYKNTIKSIISEN